MQWPFDISCLSEIETKHFVFLILKIKKGNLMLKVSKLENPQLLLP